MQSLRTSLLSLQAFYRLGRPYNALLPLLTIYVGYAAGQGSRPYQLVIAGVIQLLAHAVITIWNDVSDQAVDAANHTPRIKRVKQQGLYHGLLIWCAVALIISAAGLLFLPLLSVVLILSSAIVGWLYNARPVLASHRPIASQLVLAIGYGLLPCLVGYSLGNRQWGSGIVLLALGLTLARSSLSLLKDYKDAHGDASSNKKTFLLVYGGTVTARLSINLATIGYLSALIGARLLAPKGDTFTEFIVVAIAVVLIWERSGLLKAHSYTSLNDVFHRCLHHELLFVGGLGIWLTMS